MAGHSLFLESFHRGTDGSFCSHDAWSLYSSSRSLPCGTLLKAFWKSKQTLCVQLLSAMHPLQTALEHPSPLYLPLLSLNEGGEKQICSLCSFSHGPLCPCSSPIVSWEAVLIPCPIQLSPFQQHSVGARTKDFSTGSGPDLKPLESMLVFLLISMGF